MTADTLAALRERYLAYVDTFRVAGALPPMMELKLRHTFRVIANAKLIAAGEGFDAATASYCAAAALLHDTGRYEQLKRYHTFRDSESVDHAVFSHELVKDFGWLASVDAAVVLPAVLHHNRRELPAGLEGAVLAVSQCVRDADKLDIFTVLEERVAVADWRNDCTAFWNLPVSAPPNPEVLAALRERRPVDYQNIRSLADFVLIQVGWIRNELYFATSRRLARERGHLEFRRRFLGELTGGNREVEEFCYNIRHENRR